MSVRAQYVSVRVQYIDIYYHINIHIHIHIYLSERNIYPSERNIYLSERNIYPSERQSSIRTIRMCQEPYFYPTVVIWECDYWCTVNSS